MAAIILLLLPIGACRKISAWRRPFSSNQVVAVTTIPEQSNFLCSDPAEYADSIIFNQPTGNNDYIVNPSNAGVIGKGTYFS